MKKLYICLIALVLLQVSLFAGTFDLGITLGTTTHWGESYDTSKLKLAWGVTMGVSDVWELDLQANSALVPQLFGDTTVAVLMQKSQLGQRSTGTRVAGLGVNTLLGAGLLFSDYYGPGNFMLPTHILFSLTPLIVGNPISVKRERAFTLTFAYNFWTEQVSVLFDLIKYDFYLVGTYRDYL